MAVRDAHIAGSVLQAPPWSLRLARAVSYGVNPLIFPPLLFGLVLGHFGAPAGEVAWMVGVSLLLFVMLPLGYVVRLRRRRYVGSIEIPVRRRRTRPFLFGMACSAVALGVIYGTGATAVAFMTALVACHLVNTGLLVLINLRWKISVHVTALAGFASVLLFVARTAWPELANLSGPPLLQPAPLYGLFVLFPLLMWARVRVGAHTWGQVTAGMLFGIVLPYVELVVLWKAGALAGL